MNPVAVGISGGSCSGKSTLANRLYETLGPEQCVILPQDDYFFGHGEAPEGKGGPNFDHPDAVDFDHLCAQLAQLKQGESVDRPLYDFHSHLPKAETRRMEPRPVILVDGILILHHEPMRALLDLSVFVACDAETRLARRLDRDVRERGRTAASVRATFTSQVAPMHDIYVEPSSAHATIVVNARQAQRETDRQCDQILHAISAITR